MYINITTLLEHHVLELAYPVFIEKIITSKNEKGWEWHDRRALARLSSDGDILDEQIPRYDKADWQRSTSESYGLSEHADVEQSVNGSFHLLRAGGGGGG